MSGRFCTSCGAPAPAGATFCAYCGSALVGGPTGPSAPAPPAYPPTPSAPLPSTPGAAPPFGYPSGYGGGGPYGGAPPPRRRRRWVIVLVVIVVAILVIAVLAVVLVPSYAINVTTINFVSPDNACGLNNESSYGFQGNESQSVPLTFQLWDNDSPECTISTLTTTTTGFSVNSVSVPLSIASNGTGFLSFNVVLPPSPYSGALTLVVT